MATKPNKPSMLVTGLAAENRRARFDYEIVDTLEAGIMLTGTRRSPSPTPRPNAASSG
jgi:SsrA-binding protein